jgi:peptidoglycan/LPS O-acetylase OafA/YrhL
MAANAADRVAAPSTIGHGSLPRREHLAYVDGLRALAAVYVMLCHMWLEVWPVFAGKWPTGWELYLTGWLLYAHFAVTVFITISGFCLMIPVMRAGGRLRGGSARFLVRRAQRILVPFYCAMGLALLLQKLCIGQMTGTHWDISVLTDWNTSLPVSNSAILTNLMLLQDVFQVGKINHAFWSIAVEWRIYFLFPLLVLICRRLGSIVLISLGVLLPWAYFFASQPFVGQLPIQTAIELGLAAGYRGAAPIYAGLFCLGMVGSVVVYSPDYRVATVRNRVPWAQAALALAVAAILLCWQEGGFNGWGTAESLGVQDIIVGLAGVCLLVAGARVGRNPVRTVLAWKPLAFVGTFSFSLYLIHAPLIQVIWQYILAPLHPGHLGTLAALLLLGAPVIVGAAYLFYLVIERPAAAWSRRASSKRSVAPSGADVAITRGGTF